MALASFRLEEVLLRSVVQNDIVKYNIIWATVKDRNGNGNGRQGTFCTFVL